MTIKTTTHLNFRGTARAALEFYRSVFGGELTAVTYGQAGAGQVQSESDQIMWGQVEAESGFRIMAYDVPSTMAWDPGTIPMFVSIRSQDADDIAAVWVKLAQGSSIVVPLAKAGWSPLFGMLKDAFGVTWVLDVEVPYHG